MKERAEGHFLDYKSKKIKPSSLAKHICAFANADGGEIIVGIEDPKVQWNWDGFDSVEAANAHVAYVHECFGSYNIVRHSFFRYPEANGLCLIFEIEKAAQIVKTADNEVYIRKSAQSLKQSSPEEIRRIELDKGIFKFENNKTQMAGIELENTLPIIDFVLDVVPTSEPEEWLKKQKLVIDGKCTVAGVLLFHDEPQVEIPKAAIKIYRYKSRDAEGSRETLVDPISVEGHAYKMIFEAVEKVKEITESIPIVGAAGFEKISYPQIAIHEVITNAIIHRDYSLDNDVHIRIFDDRVEVESPGKLPGHVTAQNILQERFARNPKIVRLLNKFKNPPNKDVGEGLNSTFQAMRAVKLRDPTIFQLENSVLVTLKHESLASAEEIIVNYLREQDHINNSKARQICYIGDTNKMKRVFQKMQDSGIIERVPDRPQTKTIYRRGQNFPQ